MAVFVVDAKIQISSPAFFFPTAGGPGQSGLVLIPRLLAPGPAQRRAEQSQPSFENRFWSPVWAQLYTTLIIWPGKTLMAQDEILRAIGTITALNRKSYLSLSFWTHSNIYYSWSKDYHLNMYIINWIEEMARRLKLKTLTVSWWLEYFSGPGCWIIASYCVRVRVTEIIRFIVWIWAFIINMRIKF